MKFRTIVILALLFIMSTSHADEFLFSFGGTDSCSSTDYVSGVKGINSSTNKHCEIHCEYHSPLLLPQFHSISKVTTLNLPPISKQYLYTFQTKLKFFKPPIV